MSSHKLGTKIVSYERLREVLTYDAETGVFVWAFTSVNRSHVLGRQAGTICIQKDGRANVRIRIDSVTYSAHRLAWLYIHKAWPAQVIDHINGDPLDNRIVNLREANALQNQANKRLSKAPKSGFIGVFRTARDRTWKARIRVHGKIRYLGSFDSPELASAAYLDAHRALHGEFSGIELKKNFIGDRANGLPSVV